MPKALQRWATRAPTRPRPTMPRVLPYSSAPWKRLRSQRPSRRAASAWGMLRAWARIRATAPATAASSSSRVMAVRASTSWAVRSSSTPASASGSAIRTFAMSPKLPLVLEPRHHPAQGLPGPLDRVVRPGLAHPGEVGPALVVLVDPLAGEGSRLDLGQDAAHLGLGAVVDDPGPAAVVAVLGRVRDRVAHAGQAALVHQVDDQLELVQALEIGDLGLVAGLGQGLE